MSPQRENLIERYQKTPTSKGFIRDLYDYAFTVEQEVEYLDMFGNQTQASYIDNYYYYAWSGDKWCAPVLMKLKDVENWQRTVASMFWTVHREQLKKEWLDFVAKYDAVNNYHTEEQTSYSHQGSSGHTDSGTDSKTRSGSYSETGKVTTTNKSYPYNSTATAVNHDVTEIDKGNTASTDKPTTTFNSLQDSITYGKHRISNEFATDGLTTEKSGNLGVMPAAQLLQMDIELWKMNFYTTIMFPLIDKFLCLSIY